MFALGDRDGPDDVDRDPYEDHDRGDGDRDAFEARAMTHNEQGEDARDDECGRGYEGLLEHPILKG